MPTPWPWPPGTIVVCIRDNDRPRLPFQVQSAPLVVGAYYTIRRSLSDSLTLTRGVYLQEITCNLHPRRGIEHGFMADKFKPAESTHCERETTRAQQPQKVAQ
jgi:hypothetical protein